MFDESNAAIPEHGNGPFFPGECFVGHGILSLTAFAPPLSPAIESNRAIKRLPRLQPAVGPFLNEPHLDQRRKDRDVRQIGGAIAGSIDQDAR